jgi:hypothetical protein
MSRFEKALVRLLARPKDFTWRELQMIMNHLGYTETRGSGSRRKFVRSGVRLPLILHEPHPDGILKRYAVDRAINHINEYDLL